MNQATISADIIGYTALKDADREILQKDLKALMAEGARIFKKDGFYGRIVSGDQIEIALSRPAKALRLALMLKTWIKFHPAAQKKEGSSRYQYFKQHGIRLAVAIAPLNKIDPEGGIIDGEAIFLSGRKIKHQSTSRGKRITIRNTLFFCSENQEWDHKYTVLFALIDELISKAKPKQCQAIYYKLGGYSENDIIKLTGRAQANINTSSTTAGWHAIEQAVLYFESQFS